MEFEIVDKKIKIDENKNINIKYTCLREEF